MSFRLLIVTPNGVFLDKEVDAVYVPTIEGSVGILTGHAPYISAVSRIGLMHVEIADQTLYFAVFGGSVRVERDRTYILTEEIEDAETIDMARALSARDRALDRIASRDPGIDVARAEAALERANIRLNLVKTVKKG